MKKRLLSVLMVAVLLLSAVPHAMTASPAIKSDDAVYEPVQVQYLTETKFEQGQSGGYISLSFTRDPYVFYSPDGSNVFLIDVYGNTVLPERFSSGGFLTDNIMRAGIGGDQEALYYNFVRKTDYIYSSFHVGANYLCAIRFDESRDFFDLQLNRISIPKPGDNWEVYDLLVNGSALLRRKTDRLLVDGVKQYEYNICDQNGMVLMRYSALSEIEKYSEDLLYYRSGGWLSYLDLEGNTLLQNALRLNISSSPAKKYHLARFLMDSKAHFQIFDEHMNPICNSAKLSKYYPYEEISFFSDDKLLISLPENEYAVIDVYGKELFSCKADQVKIFGGTGGIISSELVLPEWGLGVQSGDCYTVYDMDLKESFVLSDVRSAYVAAYYLVVTSLDGSRTVYAKDGTELFTMQSDAQYTFEDGVILLKQNGKYAVCDQNGEPITDFLYEGFLNTGKYGLLNLWSTNRSTYAHEYYLLNAVGQTLNTTPLAFWVYFSDNKSVTDYKIGEKYGIIRYVGPNDPTFLDAPADKWYNEAVEYCAQNGLFAGTAVGRFSPEDAMTRAMLVSVLWRLDGKPSPQNEVSFSDVADNAWYAEAVAWAAENEIVFGVGDGKFAPDDNITREQIAAIILRYAKKKNYDTEKRADISTFTDAGRVSDYAKDAISWANGVGILSGSQEGSQLLLLPQDYATRAQLASILMRFVKNIAS